MPEKMQNMNFGTNKKTARVLSQAVIFYLRKPSINLLTVASSNVDACFLP